ncbi:LamG-like jellyroll fold domain-containing protein [Microtetraspora malaysiensis]|uniref:LamG-like jellyroll fold domain-containing protein n=1 Tax=Microtetraspora malaysiensis TaxID=161358 RepID=UPI003D8CCD09
MTAADTQSSWTWAYPDSRLTTQSWAGPTRVRQPDGTFRWVDTTLEERDGALQPKMARADVRISVGGDTHLAALERDDRKQSFALEWPTTLPKPRIEGNKAIYDVSRPGMKADLVVTALASGFRHDVVLHERPTVSVEFRLPVRTTGLSLAETKSGGLKLTDAKGKAVAAAAEPFMTEASSTDAKTGPNMRGDVKAEVVGKSGNQTLVITPDQEFLADKDTSYPVTVDPTVSLTAASDAWVQSRTGAADATGSVLNVGTGTYWQSERRCSGSVCTYTNKTYPNFLRGYVKFEDSNAFLGKYIDAANIDLVGYYTGPCSDARLTASAITASWTTSGLSWSSLPATTSAGAVTTQPSCDSGIITNTINVTQMAKTWAAGTPNHGVELKSNEDPRSSWPDDPNPVTAKYWSFDSVESGQSPPRLSVTYLLPPEIPTVTGESIDSIVGNDAISRTSDVKINYSSTSIDGKKLDYLVSISDPTTPIPVPTSTPSPSPSPTPTPSPTSTGIPGLVAAYGMNEGSGATVADASGSGNTGTASATSWAAGKFGQALSFNGTSSWVTVKDSPSLRLTNKITMEAWVKPASISGWRTVLMKESGPDDGSYALYSSISTGPGVSGGPATDLLIDGYSDGADSLTKLAINTWSHIAGTYDGTSTKIYINGSLAGETTVSGNVATGAAPLRIGGNNPFGDYFSGLIDEVRIYNTALTQGQIQADMNTPVGAAPGPDNPPSAPGTLTAVAGPDTVDLSWGAAIDDRGAVTYQVHRSKTAGFTPSTTTRVATVSDLAYADSGMVQGQYYYRVVAIDSAGQAGPASNEVSALTSAQLFPPISSALSGQVIRSEFNLGSPDSFKFKIKVCLTGVTPRICNETPFYRITSDAPHLPTDLATGTEEPLNPTLSGIVSRPSGGPVKGRFYLYQANGTPLGPVPLAEGEVSGGERLTARVPDGLITEDGSYYWRMDACLAEICTPKTAPVPFGAPVPEPESPPTQQVTLSGNSLTIRSASASATACGGTPCPLTPSTTQVGGAGAARKVSLIKADMSSLPPGALIASAVLDLGGATCNGPCPNSQVIAAHFKKNELEENPTGSALVADLVQQSQQQVQVGTPEIDVTANANGWRHEVPDETFIDPGVAVLSNETVPPVELGGSGASRPTSLRVTYRPAGPPEIIPRIDIRQGDGGALLRWARPDDLGADTTIQNFDLEVLDAGNTVVRSLTVTEATVIVGGLTNGATYRFQVRTRTPFGVGPWKVSADTVPLAVPGGPTAYQDAVGEYAEARQSLLDKRTENTGEAVEDANQAAKIEPMLYARQQDLVTTRVEDRATDGVRLADTLVSKLDDDTVVVRSAVTGTTVYNGQDDPVKNEWTTTEDFVFAADANGNGQLKLSGEKSASAVDAMLAGNSSQINAWAGGVAPDPVTELPPVDDSTAAPPALARTLAATTLTRREKAAFWAVLNVGPATSKGWEYPNDCANFVSKALARGGKFRQIHIADWFGWLNRRSEGSWWERGWKDDSFTFAAANKNYEHFMRQRFGQSDQTRATVSATYTPTDSRLSNVKIGDTIYFLNRKTGEYTHMGIVTDVKGSPPINIKQVYFAQHGGDGGTGSGPFMNLGERFKVTDFSGLVFGRVGW